MLVSEASKILKMLLGYLKGEIEPPNPKTIEEAEKFEQEGYECLNIAIRNLDAWEKVKDDIKQSHEMIDNPDIKTGYEIALIIIDKHLKEAEEK